jgi:hypothetical protein
LFLVNAAFTIWAGFTVLSGPEETWRGSFLAALAVAHLALGLLFLVRNGDRHPFGPIVLTGVAPLTRVVPVQFGGPPVLIGPQRRSLWRGSPSFGGTRTAPASRCAAVRARAPRRHRIPGPDLAAGIARTWLFVGPEA